MSLQPFSTSQLTHKVTVMLSQRESVRCPAPKAIRALITLMDMEATFGGAASHFGGPSAFSEIFSASYGLMEHYAKKKQMTPFQRFHFVNDAGHCENALYAIKVLYSQITLTQIKTFRKLKSSFTGHGEALHYPQGVLVSNGPLGSSLAVAEGLAYGDALRKVERLSFASISDGGLMEGEAKEALASIPGLAKKNKLAPFILLISDNKKKLSGTIEEQSYNMTPSIESLETLGWRLQSISNGNNLEACANAISSAIEQAFTNPTQPIALRFQTQKGFGTQQTVSSPTGAHGFPLKNPEELDDFLKEIYEEEAVPTEFIDWKNELIEKSKNTKSPSQKGDYKINKAQVKKEKIQVGISQALIDLKKKNYPIFSVSSDLQGSTGVKKFQDSFPDCAQDIGVSEANMISLATGLSKQGFIPIVDTFAQFGLSKGLLPLIMSTLSASPMICVFSHIGFQDAADGASHQALNYFSVAQSLPRAQVFSLSCSEEAYFIMTQAIQKFHDDRQHKKIPPSYIFLLGRENFPQNYGKQNYLLGKAQVLFDNSEQFKKPICVIANGNLIPEALKAAHLLSEQKRSTIVIHPSIINEPDLQTLRTVLKKTNYQIVTVEDHVLQGGMGSTIVHKLCLKADVKTPPLQVRSLCVKQIGCSAYTAQDLYQEHGLNADAIVQATLSF